MRRLLTLLVLLVLTVPAGGQNGDADARVETMRRRFANLHQSLQNSMGVTEESLPAIRRLRGQVESLLEERSRDPHLLAMDVQLSAWLDDDEGVHRAYGRLIEVAGNPVEVGEAWIGYFRRKRAEERVDEIYRLLMERLPDAGAFRVAWAERLEKQGRFQQALGTLEDGGFDLSETPEAQLTLANCLMAVHEFQRAVSALDAIPTETLESNRSLKVRADFLRKKLEPYVELWAEEQTLRAAEAEADDLPRVALETDRGRLVVELFENQAPNTVANFIDLVRRGVYDGTTFHAVVPGMMVQGGDPTTATAESGENAPETIDYTIPDELGEDARAHFRGSVAMSKRGAQADSAASEFYIALRPIPERNDQNVVFGRVIEGMEALQGLEQGDRVRDAEVLRTRDHEYVPEKVSPEGAETPAPAEPQEGEAADDTPAEAQSDEGAAPGDGESDG